MKLNLDQLIKSLRKTTPFKQLIFSSADEYPILKGFVGFFYGFFLGLIFYRYILSELSFTDEFAFGITLTICLMLGIGLAVSSQVRCITLLTFPSFSGKVGRSVLKALVITLVISGPIENIAKNSREVVRVFACTATLSFNLTKTRFSLMFKPFSDAIFGLKSEIYEVKDTIRSIRDVSAPVTGELEGEQAMKKLKEQNDYLDELAEAKISVKNNNNETENVNEIEAASYEKQYLKKIETRCMNQFLQAAIKCRKMFENAYDKCYDGVTWMAAWLLCWPMKLDYVCNIAEALGGTSRCDPSKHIDEGFGDGYAYLKQSRVALSQNFKDVKMQFKIDKIKPIRDLRDARDTAATIINQMKTKQGMFQMFFNIIKRLLALVVLRILLDAQLYEEKYLQDIEFDNIYITKYFRKIDARRRAGDKYTLLPLKKLEQTQLVDPLTWKPLKTEKEAIVKESFLLMLEMITATAFILLDRLFFEALDIIRRHARIEYRTTGKHDLKLEIKGTGMIAGLFRSLLKGFNVKKRIKMERNNQRCLPHPFLLSKWMIVKIFGTYFAIWTMLWIQAYTKRLRHIICAYFFRKREKTRVLFLYNQTLKRRKGLFRHMVKNLKRKARERRLEENYNVIQIMTIKYPKQFGWLRFLDVARKKCLLCEEIEPRKLSTFLECPTDGCHFMYCQECWRDMGNICLVCQVESDFDNTTSDDDENNNERYKNLD